MLTTNTNKTYIKNYGQYVQQTDSEDKGTVSANEHQTLTQQATISSNRRKMNLKKKLYKLKHQIKDEQPTKAELQNKSQTYHQQSQKRNVGLYDKQRPARKHQTNYSNQLHRTNYDNVIKIRRTIENSTGLQSDPAGNIINLRKKKFTKDLYKILNKNLIFVPTVKKFAKKILDEEVNGFYRRIKLKAHFRYNTKVKEKTEEDIFKKPTNKKWAPNENHYNFHRSNKKRNQR